MKRLLFVFLLCASPALAIQGFTELESVTTAAGEEIGSGVGRVELTIINTDTTNPVCCAYVSTVTCSAGTNTDGQRIAAGAGYTWDAKYEGSYVAEQPIFCRASGATVTVTYDQVRK